MDYKEFYKQRFAWRKEEYFSNFSELAELTNKQSLYPLDSFPCLYTPFCKNQLDSLSCSILLLTFEATICYTYGIFQSCIITCGAIVERILRFEYSKVKHDLPDTNYWTLGRLISKLDWSNTKVTDEILDLAKKIKSPRNDRAHGILEQFNPELANMGGENRGILALDESKYIIEPYRGDAKRIIKTLFQILTLLYEND